MKKKTNFWKKKTIPIFFDQKCSKKRTPLRKKTSFEKKTLKKTFENKLCFPLSEKNKKQITHKNHLEIVETKKKRKNTFE